MMNFPTKQEINDWAKECDEIPAIFQLETNSTILYNLAIAILKEFSPPISKMSENDIAQEFLKARDKLGEEPGTITTSDAKVAFSLSQYVSKIDDEAKIYHAIYWKALQKYFGNEITLDNDRLWDVTKPEHKEAARAIARMKK